MEQLIDTFDTYKSANAKDSLEDAERSVHYPIRCPPQQAYVTFLDSLLNNKFPVLVMLDYEFMICTGEADLLRFPFVSGTCNFPYRDHEREWYISQRENVDKRPSDAVVRLRKHIGHIEAPIHPTAHLPYTYSNSHKGPSAQTRHHATMPIDPSLYSYPSPLAGYENLNPLPKSVSTSPTLTPD